MKHIAVGIIGIVLLCMPRGIFAVAPDLFVGEEHIISHHDSISIRADGTMHVEEQIQYDFSQLYKHGIYRDIPYVKTNDAGKKYSMDFSGVNVRDSSGKPYTFSQTHENENIRWKIGDADKTITGVHGYELSYTVSGALTYFPEHDELYWNAVGTNWQVPVTNASVTVGLPNGVPKDELHVTCFTGTQGTKSTDCTTKITSDRSVLVETTRPLEAYEGLSVVVGFPKGMVAVLEPREVVPFFDTFWGQIVAVLMMLSAIFWYVIAPVMVVWKWWTSGRDPKPAMGEVKAWFSPPKTQRNRPLSPAETGTLVDERADLRDIYASIIDLARRGYLTIIETKKNEFDLEKRKDWPADGDTLPFERELLNGIFKSKDKVSIKDVDLTSTLTKVKNMLYDSLVADKFFPNNPQVLRNWYIALSVLSFIIFNPILLLVSLIFGQHMPKKTLFGAEQAAVARSLKNFLASQDKQLAFQAKKQMMFEKLLAFAVAFGVEEIWAARFKSMGIKNPDWYQSSTGSRFNSVIFAHSLGSGMSHSFASSIASHSSTGHSSGFSGGGFSGGGGGGGGGGSW